MDVTTRDIFLVSPELAMVGLAIAVVGLDLLFHRKGIVIAVAVVGLLVPLVLGINLWNDVHSSGVDTAFGGALIVDKFALYFKFLIMVILALLFLSSAEYSSRFHPNQAEFTPAWRRWDSRPPAGSSRSC